MFEKLYTMKDGVLHMRASEAGQMQVLEEASEAILRFDFEGNPRFPKQIIQTGKAISYWNKGQIVNALAGAYLAAYKYAAFHGKESLQGDKQQEKADKMEDFFIRPILPETAKSLMASFNALKKDENNIAMMDVSGRNPEDIGFIPVWIGPEEKKPLDGKTPFTVSYGVFDRVFQDENSVSLYQSKNSSLKSIRYLLKDTPLTIIAKDGKGPRFNKFFAAGEVVALMRDGEKSFSEKVYSLGLSEVKGMISSFTPRHTSKRNIFSFFQRDKQKQKV